MADKPIAETKKDTKEEKFKKPREFHRAAYSKSANNQVVTKPHRKGSGTSSPSQPRSQSTTALGKEKGRSGTPRNDGSRGSTPKTSRSGTPKELPKYRYSRVSFV